MYMYKIIAQSNQSDKNFLKTLREPLYMSYKISDAHFAVVYTEGMVVIEPLLTLACPQIALGTYALNPLSCNSWSYPV